MKYLYIKTMNRELCDHEDHIIPVTKELRIKWFQGKAYLAHGDNLLFDVDKHNQYNLIPFLAESFNHCDCVTIQLANAVGELPVIKRGLEE